MKPVFMTGMFRSGTTTLARALNTHPDIAFASDPFNEIFKALRSEEAAQISQQVPVMAPLRDYYFDPDGQALLQRLLWQTKLDRPFIVWTQGQLLERLRPRCETYSQSLAPRLENVRGDTYREMLESLLWEVKKTYGRTDVEVVGFKEVWTTEFIPAIARTWPNARFITVVRDPRAVCASKNVREERYPWTFMASQWRKLAALDYLFRSIPELENKVLQVRYEDFVLAPQEVTQRICEFLGLPWAPAMADPSTYKNGAGERWYQNTSYGSAHSGFDATAIRRWRNVLTERETRLIELMCGPEMALQGYEQEAVERQELDREILLCPPRVSEEDLASWMKGIVPNDEVSTSVQIAREKIRFSVLWGSLSDSENISDELVNAAFLDRKIMEGALRKFGDF